MFSGDNFEVLLNSDLYHQYLLVVEEDNDLTLPIHQAANGMMSRRREGNTIGSNSS